MGEQTAISWTDHTFQPWMGCTKVPGSPACDHCYAEALGKRTGKVQWGDDAQRVFMAEAYWRNPEKWNRKAEAEGRRHRVFCASLADVFEDRPELHTARIRLLELIERTPWLDWQLLTKRPQNVHSMVMERWNLGTWPHNVWVGTTVEDQEHADERVPILLTIPAVVRFLSCEPLLGRVVLRPDWLVPLPPHFGCGTNRNTDPAPNGIDWVICGGESGGGHRPMDLDHARTLRDHCRAAGVPFFFKQDSGPLSGRRGRAEDELCIKEFPRVAR